MRVSKDTGIYGKRTTVEGLNIDIVTYNEV